MLVEGGGWVEGEVDQFEAPVQMLVEGGGWVEGEVDQFEASLQMLVVVVGGVGRGRGPSIESTSTNVGGGRRVVRGRGPSI